MSWFYLYMLFAVTTAITAIYELFHPVISNKEKEATVENKILLYLTFFFISILMAPLVVLSCIIPSMGLTFRFVLTENLFKQEK